MLISVSVEYVEDGRILESGQILNILALQKDIKTILFIIYSYNQCLS